MRVFPGFYALGFTLSIVACLMHAWHQKEKSRTKKEHLALKSYRDRAKSTRFFFVSTEMVHCLRIVVRQKKKPRDLFTSMVLDVFRNRIVDCQRNLKQSTNTLPYTNA